MNTGTTTRAALVFGRSRARAFTLLEVLLTLSLVGLLGTIVSINFLRVQEDARLEHGATQFETMLRMARADAANSGRQVRVVVSRDDGAYRVEWEPQPLTEPGRFIDYTAATWPQRLRSGQVKVSRLELTGDSAAAASAMRSELDADTGEAANPTLTFYPDGSCDSALLELEDAQGHDDRRALIELDGLNGTITTRFLTPSEQRDG